jgi:hypothetical protein
VDELLEAASTEEVAQMRALVGKHDDDHSVARDHLIPLPVDDD